MEATFQREPLDASAAHSPITMEGLSPKEKGIFDEFKKTLGSEIREQDHDLDLVRWTIHAQWKLKDALELYRNHLKWRARVGADHILEEFPKSPYFDFCCKHYPASHSDKNCPKLLHARDGSMLCIEMMGNLNVDALTSGFVPLDEVIKYHIWSMEYNEKIRRDYCKQIGYKELVQAVVIEDLHDLGTGHLKMIYVISQFSAIDSVNYPELLRKVYVLNVPPVFGMVWNGVKYIWSGKEQDRMKFISSGSSELTNELSKVIHPDFIPVVYGGNLDYTPPKKCTYDEIMADLKQLPKKEFAQKETIGARDSLKKEYPANESNIGTWVHYEFKADGATWFSVLFDDGTTPKPVPVIEAAEYKCHEIPVFGRFKLEKAGKYILHWDNTGSWINKRHLEYNVQTGLPK